MSYLSSCVNTWDYNGILDVTELEVSSGGVLKNTTTAIFILRRRVDVLLNTSESKGCRIELNLKLRSQNLDNSRLALALIQRLHDVSWRE